MIRRHDSVLLERSLHIPGKWSKTIDPRKSAILTANFANYHAIQTTCLAALFAPRSREPQVGHPSRRRYLRVRRGTVARARAAMRRRWCRILEIGRASCRERVCQYV